MSINYERGYNKYKNKYLKLKNKSLQLKDSSYSIKNHLNFNIDWLKKERDHHIH